MEENKKKIMSFDIDQNKQKINYLLGKTKDNQTAISNLDSRVTSLEDDVSEIQADIIDINADISDLQELVTDLQESQNSNEPEETFESVYNKSYDVGLWRNCVYRNNLAVLRDVFFCCKEFSQVKFQLEFPLENHDNATTTTINIYLDDDIIYTDQIIWTENGTTNYTVEHTFTSDKRGYRIFVKASTGKANSTSNYIKMDMLKMQLWGTNVMIFSQNDHFQTYSSDTHVCMSTDCIDNIPRFSFQPADSSLSLNPSTFRTYKTTAYWQCNRIVPYIDHIINNDGTITYSTSPSVLNSLYKSSFSFFSNLLYRDISSSETTPHNSSSGIITSAVQFSPSLHNLIDNNSICVFSLAEGNSTWLTYNGKHNTLYTHAFMTETLSEIAGIQRIGNTSTEAPLTCVICRANGTAFFGKSRFVTASIDMPRLELGYGCSPHVYYTDEGIVVYLRHGNDVKKIRISPDPANDFYKIDSTEILPNIQSYWLCGTGAHFERQGSKIYYYPASSTTSTTSLQLDF